MQGLAAMEFSRCNELEQVDLELTTKKMRTKLNLEPDSENIQKLKQAGAFSQRPLVDFEYNADPSEGNPAPPPKSITVYTAPDMLKGVTVGTMFADGTADIGVKAADGVWARYRFPLHVQEILFQLQRANGLVPLGVETRISAAKVSSFCTSSHILNLHGV